MNKITLLLITSSLCITTALASDTEVNNKKLTVEFADANWNGIDVPKGQQCLKFGGINPATPKLKVSDIPAGTTAIIMEYSDRAYKPNDNGGHGKLGYTVPADIKNITIPSIKGHTFELPPAFFSVAVHRGADWDKAGAYLPPCSGGNEHPYYVTIKAISQNGSNSIILAQSLLEMGLY